MSRSLLASWRDALRESTLPTSAKAVGFVLSTYANASGYCYPSRQTIALGASVSVRTAERMVARLEAAGFLEAKRTKGGRTYSNGYSLTFPETASQFRRSGSETASTATVNGVNDDAKRRHSFARKPLKAFERGALDAAAALKGAAAGARIEDDCGRCGKRLPLADDIYCTFCAAKVIADPLINGVRGDLAAVREELGR